MHMHVFFILVSAEVQLRFGSMEVANNSYVRAGHIPSDANGGDGLLCASDTTNPTTRQWYNPNGSAVGTTPPTIGTYQSDTDGGVLLYRRGNLERDITGMYYCIISNSSGNSHTLYAGLYTTEGDTATVSGRANGRQHALTHVIVFKCTYMQGRKIIFLNN